MDGEAKKPGSGAPRRAIRSEVWIGLGWWKLRDGRGLELLSFLFQARVDPFVCDVFVAVTDVVSR